jgi:ElaB/YqjD/DUF883 family membrane-anchored ribosome-binding protein
MSHNPTASSAALIDELRNVVSQAEALLQAIGSDSDAALNALRDRVYSSLDTAKTRLSEIEQEAGRMTERAAVAAEGYVRAHPWSAVAIGASIGLLIGALLMRGAAGSDSSDGQTGLR